VLNATPAAHQQYLRIPTPIETEWAAYPNHEPPTWWTERFVNQLPEWAYLSGHYVGTLYNSESSFELNFADPTEENNILWKYYRGVRGKPYRLNEHCETLVIMGCSAISYPRATSNIQEMLSQGVRRPIVFGFRGSCPSASTDRLATAFVQSELLRRADRRALMR
jgi:hypothetical protein